MFFPSSLSYTKSVSTEVSRVSDVGLNVLDAPYPIGSDTFCSILIIGWILALRYLGLIVSWIFLLATKLNVLEYLSLFNSVVIGNVLENATILSSSFIVTLLSPSVWYVLVIDPSLVISTWS